MKAIKFLHACLITGLLLSSTTTFSNSPGSVIAVTYSGIPLVVDIVVCTNVNDPITCEIHKSTHNEVILTPVVTNFYYKYMGFKIMTPGYLAQNSQGTLIPNSFGYVLTPGSASAPAVSQIGESVPSCNGLTAINLDGVNWRCYDLAANSRTSCMLPPKNNCVAVAATVPTNNQINDLYTRFNVNNSQSIFAQPTNALIANQPNNIFLGNVLQINTPATISAASWSTDWGTQNLIFSAQQLCPCTI
ncbi:TPA: hypothetical protein NR353_001582 [Legionella pneumophila]|uniref:Secreted protein n=1 Tax=Legionella waltersii TaxID=66969 RepID=A0A0W1AGN5_9GAMM|nr:MULTISPECIES: hypothetical protein [Legionella]KTD80414.1 hypothetical protein Lwal_1111 [Legionella waltersii]MBN5936046.1 hypothetical protein [Legionella anisa]SNV10119.1 Uncharacterised protein [Legionella waltersii]HAT1129384.1 hypothetical protein [Legionella pneumophila]HAT1919927.1 hypothetical protein [Legionella pneumophila]